VIVAHIDTHRDRFVVEPSRRVLSEHGIKIAPGTYCAAVSGGAGAINGFMDLHRRIARGFRSPVNPQLRIILGSGTPCAPASP
jgi:hypothetical protein